MRILGLELENFMTYRGVHALDLADLGLVQVSGANQDDPGNNDNGAGKSTILEALTWGLFGEGLPRRQGASDRGVHADEVIPDLLKGQTRVSVYLFDEAEDREIAIVRWRKYKEPDKKRSSGLTIRENGQHTTYLDVSEGNRHVRRALGLDREIWVRSVIFGQESTFNFCEAPPKARADILTTVMGLEAVDRWLGRCRDERKRLKPELAREEGALSQIVGLVEQVRSEDPQAKIQTWEDNRETLVAAESKKRDVIAGEGLALRQRLAALPKLEEPTPPRGNLDPAVLESVGAAETEMYRLRAEIGSANMEIERVRRDLFQIRELRTGATCPTCQQPISAAHKAACEAAAAARVQAAGQERTRLQAAQTQAQARYSKAAEARAAAEQQLKEARSGYQVACDSYRMSQTARMSLEHDLKMARGRWQVADERIRELQDQPNPFLELQAEWDARLEGLQAEEQALASKVAELRGQLDVLDWWDLEFPRFKTWIFDAVVDVLAAEANRWIKVMSGGVCWIQISTQRATGKGQMRDEIDVQLNRWNPDGSIVSRPYRVWSGGEKRRVALAVDLGLSRLMARRASKPYRFLALDEVDRHLDAKGREGLKLVLEELRKERDTVLVITHDDELRASFDRSIMVCKSGGQSAWELRDESISTD